MVNTLKYVVTSNIFFQQKKWGNNLLYLYTPFLGLEAVSLYTFLLTNLLTNNSKSINNDSNSMNDLETLLKATNLTYDKFKKIKSKLEAVDLVKTYHRAKTNCYNFKLFEPLNINSFFENKTYLSFLKHAVKNDYIKNIKIILNYEDLLENHISVSKQEDIFFEWLNQDDKNCQDINCSNEKHKIKSLLILWSKSNNVQLNNIKEILSSICQLKSLYNISNKNIEFLLNKSYKHQSLKDSLDLNTFKTLVYEMYDNKIMSSGDFADSSLILLNKIKEMEFISNFDYLSKLAKTKHLNVTNKIRDLIKNLNTSFKLNNGVINCLLDFVSYFSDKNNFDIEKTYELGIKLQNLKIQSAEEAMKFFKVTINKDSNDFMSIKN